jgi:hypothetical protein
MTCPGQLEPPGSVSQTVLHDADCAVTAIPAAASGR